MAEDDKTTEVDMETLSDEDFLKLDVPPAEVVEVTKTEENDDANNSSNADKTAADLAAASAGGGDGSEGSEAGDGEGGQKGAGAEGEGGGKEGGGETQTGGDLTDEQKAAAAEAEKTKGANSDKDTLTLKTDKAPDADAEEQRVAAEKLAQEKTAAEAGNKTVETKNDGETEEEKAAAKIITDQADATNFFEKVSAVFKADGKDVQVRSAEEAIRLMQMGVNYSKRMQEMKPLRAMNAMLEAHGLNDPDKLNELIHLSKGSKEAVLKHLKAHNIDPLDLDATKVDDTATPNYRADPKDVAFQDAINNTLQADGGKELLADVNREWDPESKEALRETPSLFNKLLDQKATGVYEQIQTELLHQRTMGYLVDVPFLQAYEQVGNAMQKAGVFDTKETSQKKTGLAPIASGSRKSAAPKTEPTNPNLSSTSKSRTVVTNETTSKDEPDYLSMSDADFLKMAQPG